ncbi:MAG: undecaprenyldiphospho-muramoylpentapeptide beta-N-acetylglucosaminyltransferase [Candidatus Omnitrophica bacterium]|nr:undecaprenyldiphospho-muramoylpentapeptide beta-N-acetylglucosaminyltransferase [Candidatus Omnitrophota bacterium]
MKVLAVSGSSGGHIFPAISFLEALSDKKEGIETLLVLPERSKKIQVLTSCRIKYIATSVLRPSFELKNLAALFQIGKSFFQSLFILIEFQPQVVIGFGTIDSIPILFFAWLFRINTIIHEQNVALGKANKVLSKIVDKVAVSFAASKDCLKDNQRIVFTGNPIRRQLEKVDKFKALNSFGFLNNKFTILVMGGSQGSHRINEAFIDALGTLKDKDRLQIIHLTGSKDFEFAKKRYKDLNIVAKVFDFFESMENAYCASDLAICRAGATTVTELMYFRLPAIFIPYPHAYGHQLTNALELEKKGCSLILEEENLNNGRLKEAIELLLASPQKINDMRQAYDSLSVGNAALLLADEVVSLVKS